MANTGQITWLGHATIRLTLPDERVIFIDPWLVENPSCPEPEKTQPRCDMIVLTHAHFDHVGDVGALVDAHRPHVVAAFELAGLLEKRHPSGVYAPMGIGGTQVIEGVRISLTPAFHSSGLDSPDGPVYAGMPCGVIIQIDGLATLYHAGDTDVFGDMALIRKRYAPKIVCLPIGDHFTMGPAGAALAAELLSPEAIIPLHYETFPVLTGTPDALRDALPTELRDKLVVCEPGQPRTWTESGVAS